MNSILNKRTTFLDVGLKDYQDAWDFQTQLFNETLSVKSLNRELSPETQKATNNWVIFCSHPHVYTLGKTGKEENLLVNAEELNRLGATYHKINRGGDITYHGPGQIVVYPVIDLENFFTDIHKYMRLLEESVILTCRHFGISCGRIPGLTGVWVAADRPDEARKICALGVKTSRWVTMHGLAFNVNTDLSFFGHIIPCGIDDKAVTSLSRETGVEQDVNSVAAVLKRNLIELFEMEVQ